MAALLLVLGSTVGVMIWNGEMAGTPAASGIAVLPFESLSSDKENAFFADGVYDGVSTKLAKVANLKVISHNSVAKYRGERYAQEIGRALNVAYVLEGSVRRETGRIHLNAQLIDTRTDAHVWAQEYDRALNDVFTLQSEIAQKIADQLGAEVSSSEKAAIQEPPTTDLVAYDSYLRGKDLISGISWITRMRGLNCPKRPFNRFAVCVPNLERRIWLWLNISTGHMRITIGHGMSWLPPGVLCLTNREFLFCLATLIGAKVTWRNLWRK